MIITKQKSFEDIVGALKSVDAHTVYLVGCGACATSAKTGGEPEVAELASKLTGEGFEVVGSFVAETTCHVAHVSSEIRKRGGSGADATVVLACGSGVQAVSDAIPDTPVFPALDSLFIGNTLRQGNYVERCKTCGACGLGAMAGICPLAGCPKGLLNGPCGAMWNGLCGTADDSRKCVHVLIRERLEAQGRPALGMIGPKDRSVESRGDTMIQRKKRQGERA